VIADTADPFAAAPTEDVMTDTQFETPPELVVAIRGLPYYKVAKYPHMKAVHGGETVMMPPYSMLTAARRCDFEEAAVVDSLVQQGWVVRRRKASSRPFPEGTPTAPANYYPQVRINSVRKVWGRTFRQTALERIKALIVAFDLEKELPGITNRAVNKAVRNSWGRWHLVQEESFQAFAECFPKPAQEGGQDRVTKQKLARCVEDLVEWCSQRCPVTASTAADSDYTRRLIAHGKLVLGEELTSVLLRGKVPFTVQQAINTVLGEVETNAITE